jgi:cytoskeleton protein RodZ
VTTAPSLPERPDHRPRPKCIPKKKPRASFRDKPDGETDPAGEAGWYLEREREARGLSLEEAGEAVGIHPYHLEAIELGDMTCMPERLEALEMIGAYAQFLGFDPEPLVEHYALFLPVPPLAAEIRHPANPAPLSSAKILAFGRLPRFPKFRLTGVPGGAGGLVASLAAVMLLFAGASYLLIPNDGEPAQGLAQQGPSAASQTDADPMPTASTGPETAEISVGEEPMPDDGQAERPAISAGEDDLAGTGLDGISALIEQNVPGAASDAKALEAMASATDVAITGQGREFGAGNEGKPADPQGQRPRLGQDRGCPGQCGDDPDADEGRYLPRAEPRGPRCHRA